MAIEMNISSWRPGYEERLKHGADGSISAEFYTDFGVVEFFTFPGADNHREFTSMKMFLHPRIFSVTLPRFYSSRWARRLSNNFAVRCFHLVYGE